jgi:hypothetical protein
VQQIRPGVYRCRQCGTEVLVADGSSEPFDMLAATSGEMSERVVLVDGREVHRCSLPDHRSN